FAALDNYVKIAREGDLFACGTYGNTRGDGKIAEFHITRRSHCDDTGLDIVGLSEFAGSQHYHGVVRADEIDFGSDTERRKCHGKRLRFQLGASFIDTLDFDVVEHILIERNNGVIDPGCDRTASVAEQDDGLTDHAAAL